MTGASYVPPPLFARFRRDHPRGAITVQVSNPRLVTAAPRDGSADFGVCILDPRDDVAGLEVERLWQERLLLVAAPDCDLVGATATPAEISALPFVCSPRNQVRRVPAGRIPRRFGSATKSRDPATARSSKGVPERHGAWSVTRAISSQGHLGLGQPRAVLVHPANGRLILRDVQRRE